MQTTTASALRTNFVSAIRGITPTYAKHRAEGWRYVRSPDEVPGPRLRLFTLLSSPPVAEDPDVAVTGGGISYRFDLEVMTNYSDLPLVEDEQMIDEDARDLWLALDGVKSSDGGLIDVSYPTWVTEGATEDGHVFGRFEMEVRFFGRNA